MPGIPSLADMELVDLDHVNLRLDKSGTMYETSDLVVWRSQSMRAFGGLKAGIAELIAAIGPELIGAVCLDFNRGSD